jgi:hypothetical protein
LQAHLQIRCKQTAQKLPIKPQVILSESLHESRPDATRFDQANALPVIHSIRSPGSVRESVGNACSTRFSGNSTHLGTT